MKSPSSSQETVIPETPVKLFSSKFSPGLLEAPTQLVCFSTPIKGHLGPERDNMPTTSAMQADHSPQASNWDTPTQLNPDLLPTMQFLIAESENSGSDTECEDSSMLPTQPNLKIHQRCFGSEDTHTSPISNAKTSVTFNCKIENDKNLSQQATQVNPLTRNFFALANSESETEDENDPQVQDKSPELSSIKAWDLLPTQPIPLNQLKNPGVTISESGSDTEFEEDTPSQLARSPNIFELPTQINPIVKCDFVRAKTSMLLETNVVGDTEFDIYEQPTQLHPEIHRSFNLAYSGSDTEDEDKEFVRSTVHSEKDSLPTKNHSLINARTSDSAKSSSDTEWEEDVQTQPRHSPDLYEQPTQINPLINYSGRKSEREDQDDTEPVQRTLLGLKLAVLVDEPTQPNAQLSRSSSFVELEPTQPVTLPCRTFNIRESGSESSSETEGLLASPLKKLTQKKIQTIFEQETQVWAIPQTKDAKADNAKETNIWTVTNEEGPVVFERETQVWGKIEQRTTTADEETQPRNIFEHPPLQRTIDTAHETAALSPTKKSKSGESRLNERAKAEEQTQVWDIPTQRNPENPAGNYRMNDDSSTSDSEIEVGPSRSKKNLKRIPTPRKMRKLVVVSSDSDMELEEEISSEPSIRSMSRNKSRGLLLPSAAKNVIRRSQMEPVAATHLTSTSRNTKRNVESRSPDDIFNSSQLILPDTEDLTPPVHASDVTNVPVLEELVQASGKAGFASANVDKTGDDNTMPFASQNEPMYGFSREASASTPGHTYWQLIQSALSCASTPEETSPPLPETTRGSSQGQSAAAHASPQLLQASLENNNEPTLRKKRKVAGVPKPRQVNVESPVISKKAKPKTHSVSDTSKTNGFFEASELPARGRKPSKEIVPKLQLGQQIEPSKVSKSNKRKGTRKSDFDLHPETSTGTQDVTTVGVLSSIAIEPIEKEVARSLPAAVSRRKSSPEKKVAVELAANNKEMSVRGRGKRQCTLEPTTGKTHSVQTRVEKSVENNVPATNLEPKPGTSKDEHSATKFFPKMTRGRKKAIAVVEEPMQIAKVTAMRIDENEVKMTVVLAPSNISRQPTVNVFESTEKDDSPVRNTQSKKGKTAKLVQVKKESDELNENSNSSKQREAPRKRGKIAKTKLVEVKKEPEQIEEASKRKLRERKSVTFRVLFTGIDESDDKQLVKDLGGLVVDQVDICQILVTDKVRRTVKFLCAMASGIPIVSLDWLRECRIRGKFVDPVPFLLKDEEGEKQHSFQLEASLAKAKKKPLLGGWQFLLTPSILPPPPEMAGILESSGARVVSTFLRTTNEMSAAISVKDDRHLWPTYRNLRIPIIAPEAVLTGVLRQRFEVKPYELK